MESFLGSTFGAFLIQLFGGLLSGPSQENFYWLAYGWSMARGRFFVSTFIWLSGAASAKHFSRYYVFLGKPFYKALDKFWEAIVRYASEQVSALEPIRLKADDATLKRTGKKVEGASRYRNGAGTARQEYRTLWGLNFVYVTMCVPCRFLKGQYVSVPVGLRVYLKEADAKQLKEEHKRRSALAREIVDLVAGTLPWRQIQVCGDGGYATQYFLRNLPENVHVVSRLLVTGPLYTPPPTKRRKGAGRPSKKGKRIGTPKTLAGKTNGWRKHPTEDNAQIRSLTGIWHSVLPGRPIKAVIVRRRDLPKNSKKQPVEAFFSTDLTLSAEQILEEYQGRWDIEIAIRDGNELYGIGGNRCRKHKRYVGANSLCAIMAAARTLWFLKTWNGTKGLDLQRFRPWYRHKEKPSQLDITWALTEALNAQGIFAVPRFLPDLGETASIAPKPEGKAV